MFLLSESTYKWKSSTKKMDIRAVNLDSINKKQSTVDLTGLSFITRENENNTNSGKKTETIRFLLRLENSLNQQ